MNDPRAFEAVACQAAAEAGRLLRRRFREKQPLQVETKGMHDFVTAVDREVEQLVAEFLLARCPDHTIMAEEGSPEAQTSGYRWVVDPLDGTTNFLHGVPTFSVSIALEDPQGLVAGVIHDPLRDETFHAHAPEVFLRRTDAASNHGQPELGREGGQVAFVAVDQRTDDQIASVVRPQFGRHCLDLSRVEQVEQQRLEQVVTMMSQGQLGGPEVDGHVVQYASTQS